MAERQTEVLIEKMLEFLYSDEEQDEGTAPCAATDNGAHTNGPTPQDENVDDDCQGSIEKKRKLDSQQSLMNGRPEGRKNSLANDIRKLEEQFPLWGMQDQNPSPSPPNINLHAPIWRTRTLSSLDCNNEECEVHDHDQDMSTGDDWQNQLEQQRRNASNVYVQEVRKAFYGDASGYPPNGTFDYYHVAQNYAVYGKNFLDFPDNWQMLLPDRNPHPIPMEMANYPPHYVNGFYGMPPHALHPPHPPHAPHPSHPPLNNNNDPGAPNVLLVNNFIPKPNMGGMTPTGATAAAAAAAVAASSPGYFQLCNGMQGPPRPPVPGNPAAYGMFLGNKVTYVAGPPNAPPIIYNQHTATTTNFISNTLANAAFTSTPPIMYSNPMVNPNPQQYMNTFYKDPQMMGAPPQNNTPPGNAPVHVYERFMYAQMLQQQIYHQSQQQAAAFAAMVQHKQRANQAAAAAAAARAAAAANGGNNPNNGNQPLGPPPPLIHNNNNMHMPPVARAPPAPNGANNPNNGNQPLGPPPPLIHNNNNMHMPPMNLCNRQPPMMFNNNNMNPNHNNGTELIVIKPPNSVRSGSVISANGSEETMNFSD